MVLEYDSVEATNNLAERQLRPAVIARKLSCRNKTASGARTWEILASIAATCRQRDHPFLDTAAATVPILALVLRRACSRPNLDYPARFRHALPMKSHLPSGLKDRVPVAPQKRFLISYNIAL